MEQFGQRIRQERNKKGLTQLELARLINKSSQVISNWERGYTPTINQEDILRLANALEVSVDYLLGRGKNNYTIAIEDNIVEVGFPFLKSEINPNVERYIMSIREVINAAVENGDIHEDKTEDLLKNIVSYLKFQIEDQKKK